MESQTKNGLDAGQCPLCGQPNDCQLCTVNAYKGPCWCTRVEVPDALLLRVPPDLKNRACICHKCIGSFTRMNIQSPCIQVCRLDEGEVCVGCHRTRDEIARWLAMTDEEKTQVNARLAKRECELEAAHE